MGLVVANGEALHPSPSGRRKRYLCWPLALLASSLCLTAGAQRSQKPPESPRPLTTARQAHSLTSEQAARGLPIHLNGVVTYYDPFIDLRHAALFVHDASGSIFVSVPSRPILPLRAGTLIDLTGVSGAGDYAPIVTKPQIRITGQSHLPENPPRVTLDQLHSGALDGQWVEVEGLVHAVRVLGANVVLDLVTVGGPISATTRTESGADYGHLVDSLIRVHGNEAPVFNRNLQLVGAHLYFPSLEEVKVVQSGPADPFATPALPIPSLLRFSPNLNLTRRVRVQGRVTLDWPGRTLCIQQANDGICMQTAQTTPVKAGEFVDVIGFPAVRDYKATLENATYRLVAAEPVAPLATPITAAEAFAGGHDGELVRIEGDLISLDRASGDPTMILRAGNLIFPVILANGSTSRDLPLWKEGSKLGVTGICWVKLDDQGTTKGEGAVRLQSVQILLRSLGDVEVLQAPSWWTTSRTLEALGIVALFAITALIWSVVLRRRVEQQTDIIRQSEERLRHLSQHDSLTGLPNRNLLDDRMEMALARAVRFKTILGLLMVDLDHFKEVNDSFGHQAGDELLCVVGQRLRASVRKTDTVARFGGDEFIVLLPDLRSQGEAEMLAAKIVAAVSAPFSIGKMAIPVSVSIGVCTFPETGKDVKSLLKSVDDAMYCAKAQGRNGFHVFGRGMAEAPLNRQTSAPQ